MGSEQELSITMWYPVSPIPCVYITIYPENISVVRLKRVRNMNIYSLSRNCFCFVIQFGRKTILILLEWRTMHKHFSKVQCRYFHWNLKSEIENLKLLNCLTILLGTKVRNLRARWITPSIWVHVLVFCTVWYIYSLYRGGRH